MNTAENDLKSTNINKAYSMAWNDWISSQGKSLLFFFIINFETQQKKERKKV